MGSSLGPKQIVTDGLVLHLDAGNRRSYPGSGTTWFDLSGNGNDAIAVNGPVFNSNHISFDGSSDYCYLKNINYGSGKIINELTVFIWFRTTYNNSTNTSDGNVNTDNWAFLDFDRSEVFNVFIEGGGQLKFGGRSSNNGGFSSYYDLGAGTEYLLNDGKWHNASVVFSTSGQFIKFFIDGELVRTANANGSMTGVGGGTQRYGFIGDGSEAASENSSRNNIYYQGDIALVKMYDGNSLTNDQILQNYNATKERFTNK